MVAKVLWTCVLQDQRKFRSDSVHVAPLHGNRRNHHCRDDSILRANVTRYTGVALPGCGVMVGGSRSRGCMVLLVVSFSCIGKYIALLISSLGMSGAAPSTRLMKALNLRDP